MIVPLHYKHNLWTEHIGEQYKTICSKCKKDLICFDFDIKINKNKKVIFIHPKC
jgi:hypothetical protein